MATDFGSTFDENSSIKLVSGLWLRSYCTCACPAIDCELFLVSSKNERTGEIRASLETQGEHVLRDACVSPAFFLFAEIRGYLQCSMAVASTIRTVESLVQQVSKGHWLHTETVKQSYNEQCWYLMLWRLLLLASRSFCLLVHRCQSFFLSSWGLISLTQVNAHMDIG